ncbi:geranylgeranyl reductase [Methanocalculus chunghsingensis]|uniref:Geranylgeranyl reductase n=1 Tax=Methanocalculus chunghsingensis TaxID=156457 RepID=A0A8J8B667_9EURY|nr:NAD(P)/FAD-dependent oxidoreductase [Methanocalculus chunghsingensis]MBR1369883.1 geranylgeranyl reductase [Methanocalculus chunghsingensis]
MYDIVVVGGGPVGATAARLSAQAGLSTLLIEEHATIGDPIQCAGLLSSSAFAECEASERSVYNTVSGARIISGAGDELLFDAGVTKAYVVDRSALDREMMMAAGDAGAEIRVKTYARWRRPGLITIQGSSGSEEIPHRICIAADGPRSSIARAAGLGRHRYLLSGIQADIPFASDPRYVELHPDASPDFFGWVIPISAERARVGLCGTADVGERFNRFIRRYTDTSVHIATGAIPLGPLGQTYADRLMICGDAAGFPKPTSGGGIYTGIRSARHAVATAVRALESDDESRLSEYEDLWRADFGRELSLGLRLFEMRGKMTEDDINIAIKKLSQPDILRIIVEEGDMDRPGRLIRRLMGRPDLLTLFGRIGMTTILRGLI